MNPDKKEWYTFDKNDRFDFLDYTFKGGRKKPPAKSQIIKMKDKCKWCGNNVTRLHVPNGVLNCTSCGGGVYIFENMYPTQEEVDKAKEFLEAKYNWKKL